MDHRRFDAIARALGGAATRRSALGALLGLGLAGAATHDMAAKKKRKKCDPPCAPGQTCRQGACACENGGRVCGANCCATGQRCENGQCVTTPAQCIPAGEACKGVGRACCDGTVCASGQGGKDDVACHVPAGGACATTADCVYDSTCTDGTCVANVRPQPGACIPAGQSGCTESTPCCPGSTCLTQIGASSGTCIAAAACTVCPSGCPYRTVEAAIADSAAGPDISVAPGTYTPEWDPTANAYLPILRSLTLRACEPGSTVTISCPTQGTPATYTSCIDVAGSGGVAVTVSGLTVQGSAPDVNKETYGISALANASASVTLRDVVIKDMAVALFSGDTSTINVGAGVTVNTSGFYSSPGAYPALGPNASFGPGTYTCTAAVTFVNVDANRRCGGTVPQACGCSG